MDDLETLLRDLVIANRILAHEGIVDALGHVSIRHPHNPNRFFLACQRSPELITLDDLIEYDLECNPVDLKGRPQYSERPIHGAIYEARPDVNAVVHSHAHEIIPFGLVKEVPLRPVVIFAASLGTTVPVWDMRDSFGETNMLVTKMVQGRDFAKALGPHRTSLMRGHGCVAVGPNVYEAVYTVINMKSNAKLQSEALALGNVIYMTPQEIVETLKYTDNTHGPKSRPWEYWKRRCGAENLF